MNRTDNLVTKPRSLIKFDWTERNYWKPVVHTYCSRTDRMYTKIEVNPVCRGLMQLGERNHDMEPGNRSLVRLQLVAFKKSVRNEDSNSCRVNLKGIGYKRIRDVQHLTVLVLLRDYALEIISNKPEKTNLPPLVFIHHFQRWFNHAWTIIS